MCKLFSLYPNTLFKNKTFITPVLITTVTETLIEAATKPTTITVTTANVSPIPCANQEICLNSGICYIISDTVECICSEGYTGEFCENSTEPVPTTASLIVSGCLPSPCLNGGTCVTQTNGQFFGCFCKTGYTGVNCENTKNTTQTSFECLQNLCMNSGTCVADDNGKFLGCFCANGYIGVFCETFQATINPNNTSFECQQNPCMNGGTCVSLPNGTFFGCFCSTGYIGVYCETQKPVKTVFKTQFSMFAMCSPNPCMNGGTCIALGNGEYFGCFCSVGFIGTNCQTADPTISALSGCSPNPCMNSGTCVSLTSGEFYGCFCPIGFIGNYCQSLRKSQTSVIINFKFK